MESLQPEQNYRRLKWVVYLLTVAAIIMIEFLRHFLLETIIHPWVSNLLGTSVLILGSYFFFNYVFKIIQQINRALYKQAQKIAVLEERERLAREMHDGLAQTLGYMNLRIKSIQNLLGDGATEVDEGLGEIRNVIQETYNDLRQTIFNLRNELKSDWDLEQALKRYISLYQEQNLIQVTLEGFEDRPKMDELVELQLFRILQEALTNIRKHAGAKRANLVLEKKGLGIQVEVTDDGRGFDLNAVSKAPKHFGLTIMKERLRELGGSLDIITTPGQGTKIVIQVPVLREEKGGIITHGAP